MSQGSDFLIQGQHVWLGTSLGSNMGPGKSGFAMKSFRGGSGGKFP